MEALVVLIVLIALAVIAGVSAGFIAAVLLCLLGAGFCVLALYFTFCAFRIIFCSKRVDAAVSEVRKSEKYNYPTAYYEIGENIYANAFPCELVMRKQLYTVGRKCRVWLCERRGKDSVVYDSNAALSTFAGFFLALAAGAVMLIYGIVLIKGGI